MTPHNDSLRGQITQFIILGYNRRRGILNESNFVLEHLLTLYLMTHLDDTEGVNIPQFGISGYKSRKNTYYPNKFSSLNTY